MTKSVVCIEMRNNFKLHIPYCQISAVAEETDGTLTLMTTCGRYFEVEQCFKEMFMIGWFEYYGEEVK